MMHSTALRSGLVFAGLLLGLGLSLGALLPAPADAGTVGPQSAMIGQAEPVGTLGAADDQAGLIAHTRPISWPVQPGPISGTVPYSWPYVLPWWCYFPTPIAPTPAAGMPTAVPPTPVPSPTPGGRATTATYNVCRRTIREVPPAVIAEALLEPWKIPGFGELRNRNIPYHYLWNPLRTELSLLNPNVPYGICNPVVWKAGCL